MLGRLLPFGALVTALLTAPERAHASTSRECAMLGRVDRVTRGVGTQLQVDLFVVETNSDPDVCLPRGPSTNVAVEAVDFATASRVRVGSWVFFYHSHVISYPNKDGIAPSYRTRRLSLAKPADAARGESLLKQPPAEPAARVHDTFKALGRQGALAVTLSGSAARDPDPASPKLIAKWATASLMLTFARPLSSRPTLAELRQVTRLSFAMPRVGELEARMPGWHVTAHAPNETGFRSLLQTQLGPAELAKHFKVISLEGDRLVAELENPATVWFAATNVGTACMQRYVEAACSSSVGREIPLRVRFELIVK